MFIPYKVLTSKNLNVLIIKRLNTPSLLQKVMALYKQEQEPPADCQHDFDYDSSFGEIVCLNCGFIKDSLLIVTNYSYCRSRGNNIGLYLKKCITDHQEQNNCSIPYNIYNDFGNFQRYFLKSFQMDLK